MDKRYASRKFGLAVAVFVAATSLLLLGSITAQQWVEVVSWDVGLYMAGNVGDTWAEKK